MKYKKGDIVVLGDKVGKVISSGEMSITSDCGKKNNHKLEVYTVKWTNNSETQVFEELLRPVDEVFIELDKKIKKITKDVLRLEKKIE